MSYHHFTMDERNVIYRMHWQGHSDAEIARCLGRHRSSIGRECKRNINKDGRYDPGHAQTLADGPVELPANWTRLVHQRLPVSDLDAIGKSVQHGAPLGDLPWTATTAKRLQLTSALRPKGRPRKSTVPL